MNPNNEAMREAFEAYIRRSEPRTMFLDRYAKTDAMGDSIGKYAGSYRRQEIESMWIGWQVACKNISITPPRNMSGDPILQLSNGQSFEMKDIVGMADAVKSGEDDKRDAARYRWLSYAGWIDDAIMEDHKIIEGISETLDKAIDAQISAKGKS